MFDFNERFELSRRRSQVSTSAQSAAKMNAEAGIPQQNARITVRRRMSSMIGLVVLSLLPVVPMPIAGGTPIAIALLSLIIIPQILGLRDVRLDGIDLLFIVISITLLAFELVTAARTNMSDDFEHALGRFYWIIFLVFVSAFVNEERLRGNSMLLFDAIAIGVLILFIAMVSESMFYPSYEIGREFGYFKLPWPRATGVPNSDGKLGTFLVICLCVGMFYGKLVPGWRRIVLVTASIGCLLFTQSRSGILAFAAVFAIFSVYRSFSARGLFVPLLRWVFMISVTVLLVYNLAEIMTDLKGEGVYGRNVTARFDLASFAVEKIGDAPILGSGADEMRLYQNQQIVHNTVLAMAIKSGMLAGALVAIVILFPALALKGNTRFTMFKLALVSGFVIEHSLYPGFINEFLVIGYLAAKTILHMSSRPSLSGLAPVAT